jgi:phosphotriesterase-related protein
MPAVQTARGPVDTGNLGRVLMHEHVFVISTEIQQNYPEEWGPEDARVADAIRRLNELKAAGIDTILDPTALGLGRYVPRIKRIADQIGLNIIVATGLYTFDVLPHYFGSRGEDVMTSMFVRDIEKGIADTGIKAGVIKCATDAPGVTPGVERVLRCCARAHRQTGVPITTHTHARTKRGIEQQKIFKEEGVDLSRVVIGHCGDTDDIAYLEELMANGSTIGMDRFGIDALLSTEARVDTVAKLCKRGYADRMVLSHDAACYLDWIPGELPPPTMRHWNYLHISKDVLPMLRERGVTDAQIQQMLVDNPRRYFERQGAY